MGVACLTLPQADPLEEVRRMAHDALDAWIDTLAPLFEREHPPTLMELSAFMTRTRGAFLGGCLEALTQELYRRHRDQRQADCPGCGKRLNRKRMDAKTVSTLQGKVRVERPYFHCRACRYGFHPLDEALALAREVHQYDIQEQVLELATEIPYARAAELVSKMTGTPVSNHQQHDTLNRVAEVASLDVVIPDRDEITRRIEAAKSEPEDRPVVVVAVDGAHAPTRPKAPRKRKRGPGQWKEAKGFRLYLVGEDERIVHLASWHQIQDAEGFTKDLEEVARRVPTEQVRIALLGDGASWLWKAMTHCFPEGRPVLDYYHCAEHVHTVAKAQYGETLDAQEWAEATLARLSADQTSHVIGGLRRMSPASEGAAEEIGKLVTYLDNNRDRLGYDHCKENGLPIGSGGIESANKSISHARLKRSGAWWVTENGNNMLRLRCAMYNGTFDRVFRKYMSSKQGFSGDLLGTNA
jgi:hypothetical protein